MISLFLSSVIAVAGLQATINAPRSAFVACLRDASGKAESQKIAVDAYQGFLDTACSAQAASLKSALVAFDVKNGIKRATAESDAQAQIDDYHAMSKEKYESKMGG
ncbi:MAG: hypothetical protein ABI412_07930, partial [Sphingomicrobium sp.]